MGQTQSKSVAVVATDASVSQNTAEKSLQANRDLDAKLNPAADDARSHNFGQPIQPSDSKNASKLKTDCRAQQRASLQCIEDNYENKDVACASFFEDYKRCRRNEHERKLQKNASMF